MTKTSPVFMCSFSTGLDEIPKRLQKDLKVVLATIKEKGGRFSTFEVTPGLCHAVGTLFEEGYMVGDKKSGYPWHTVKITPKGQSLLEG